MKQCKRIVIASLVVSMLGLCLPMNVAAATTKSISSVSIKVGVDFVAGDTLADPDARQSYDDTSGTYVATNSSKYSVRMAEWIGSSTRDLAIGDEPRMKVYLEVDDDDYAFKGSYQGSNVSVSGGTFVSASRSGSDELVVTLKIKPLKGTYDPPTDAYWKESGIGGARWEAPDQGSGAYDIYLYRGGTAVHKVETLKATSYNFYPYMTKEGSYSFKVRTVPYTDNEGKYGKKSEWTDSDEYYLPKEKVSDGSGQSSGTGNTGGPNGYTGHVGWVKDGDIWFYRYPDGTYLKNTWSKINDKWYLFDTNGAMLTGWQIRNNLNYFMNDNGDMFKGWLRQNDKWYYLNPTTQGVEGALSKGWINYNSKWYFADGSGALVEGWYQVEGNWYYFYPGDGAKAVSTIIDTFRLDENGIWRK